MGKFVIKVCIFSFVFFLPIITVNYFIDPAYLYHTEIVEFAADELLKGNIIESPGDMDEGLFQERMIQNMRDVPDTVIIGSSHVMYIPWEYENYYVAGMSGAYLGDYYAIIGLFENGGKLPKRIIFGVDPWAFMVSCLDGRHDSIIPYAQMVYTNISSDIIQTADKKDNRYEKTIEMLSFPYFQASIKAFLSHDFNYYFRNVKDRIVVSQNENMEEKAKILPSGRRIMGASELNSIEYNMISAQDAIDSRNVYQLGIGLETVNKTNFKEFVELLIYLINKNIEVEIYLPSWYPLVYDFFKTDGSYAGVIETEELIREIGEIHGIIIHGSYDPQKGGVSEIDYADWLHLTADKMLRNYNVVLP